MIVHNNCTNLFHFNFSFHYIFIFIFINEMKNENEQMQTAKANGCTQEFLKITRIKCATKRIRSVHWFPGVLLGTT